MLDKEWVMKLRVRAAGVRANHRWYVATGEYRAPRKGEWFLSGAVPEAYRATTDLKQSFWIACQEKA